MTEALAPEPDALVRHFHAVATERMAGLPIVNPRLAVEAVGFRDVGGHRLGVLIAPWFMNMILLPGSDDWSGRNQGEKVKVTLPADEYEFVVCRDDALEGCYLSAVLFRSMGDFPDQSTAREVAREIMSQLFVPPPEPEAEPVTGIRAKRYSRRELLAGRGGR